MTRRTEKGPTHPGRARGAPEYTRSVHRPWCRFFQCAFNTVAETPALVHRPRETEPGLPEVRVCGNLPCRAVVSRTRSKHPCPDERWRHAPPRHLGRMRGPKATAGRGCRGTRGRVRRVLLSVLGVFEKCFFFVGHSKFSGQAS